MRKTSTLFGTLAALSLMLGLSWTIGTSEAQAADWRWDVQGEPCGLICGSYDPEEGCWCWVLDPIIVT